MRQIPETAAPQEKLRQALLFAAFFVRDNLPWIHRIFADSSSGVECVRTFIRRHAAAYLEVFSGLLDEAVGKGVLPAPMPQYFCFMMVGVIHLMIIASDLVSANLAPPLIASEYGQLIKR